jgi:hypothetical protein
VRRFQLFAGASTAPSSTRNNIPTSVVVPQQPTAAGNDTRSASRTFSIAHLSSSKIMNGKENLQLFLSPRLTARSARTAQDEDKLGDLQVLSSFFFQLHI